jgi:hypothetical protein
MILVDSHARDLSSNVKNKFNDNYSVCGFVKPGINIVTQISSMTVDINLLKKNYLIIFWGGSNDVSKNNSQEGLKNLVNFVQLNSHTNIILTCVPPRHDLPEWSCVNNEIKTFNRKLSNLMKPYKHVLIVMVDTDRQFFTRHDLHMNNLDKEKISSKVSTIVRNIFQKQNVKISLCWKNGFDISAKSVSDNITEENISIHVDSKTDQTTLEDMEVPAATPSPDKGPRISKRKKKPPTSKREDFFMVNNNLNLGSNSLTIYHQNICGLKSNTGELISSLSPNFPHILCFSEHHLKHTELDQINI